MPVVPDPALLDRLSRLCSDGRSTRALAEVRELEPADEYIGLRRILESRVVREMVSSRTTRKEAVSTDMFKRDFAKFRLSRIEGFLMSLLDRPLPVDKMMKVSTLGPFETLLSIAHLREIGALELREPAPEKPRS